MAYKPKMSQKEAKRRLEWHNAAYANMKNRKETQVTYLGRKFIVPKNVFPPAPMSKLLGKTVLDEVRKTDRVLDMGTGSGNNAILAASKSTNVMAVDINPSAIKCAKLNAELNGVSSRIKFSKANMFQQVEGKFDLIIFDPPFRWFTPRDMLEKSIADEGYKTLTAFFKVVKRYLNKNGRILIFFGTSGDLGYLKRLIRKSGLKRKTMCKKTLVRNNRKWIYYTYKLTQ